MLVISEITQTCDGCPSQWEGRTSAGAHVYVRYRFGRLQLGVGETLEAAVTDRETILAIGGEFDGYLSYDSLRAVARDFAIWPETCLAGRPTPL